MSNPDFHADDHADEPGDLTGAVEILAREAGVEPEQAARIVSVVSRFSGPMPPPKVLAAYEQCIPGSADRILAMAEKEQDFRHTTTKDAIAETQSSDTRGKRYALAVVLIMSVAAVICAALDQPWVAGVLGGGTLASLVAAFLGQQMVQRGDRQEEQAE